MVVGIEPWALHMVDKPSTTELHPQPYFLSFILKPGLTKLWRASLRRETERETERDRETESWGWPRTRILRSPPPKYWDYKREPPHPAFYSLFWNRVSLSCWGWPRTCDPPVSAPKYWDYRCVSWRLASFITFMSIRSFYIQNSLSIFLAIRILTFILEPLILMILFYFFACLLFENYFRWVSIHAFPRKLKYFLKLIFFSIH